VFAEADGQKYFGVNQPGLAFSSSKLPGVVWKDFPLVGNSSLDYFSRKGMNTVRVGVLWVRT
jgi:endoglucanase